MKILKTQRGFKRLDFEDDNGQSCSLQESSAAYPAKIWLGVGTTRMHLTKEQVAVLVPLMWEWAESPTPRKTLRRALEEWIRNCGDSTSESVSRVFIQIINKYAPRLDAERLTQKAVPLMWEWCDVWRDVTVHVPNSANLSLVFLNYYCQIDELKVHHGGKWGMTFGWYDSHQDCWFTNSGDGDWVTHWMPLPVPPSSTDSDD